MVGEACIRDICRRWLGGAAWLGRLVLASLAVTSYKWKLYATGMLLCVPCTSGYYGTSEPTQILSR
jgi:hypothetical protein